MDNQKQRLTKPEELSTSGRIYSSPKSLDQRVEDDLQREKRFKRRVPKLPWLFIPLFGSIIYMYFAWLVQSIPILWSKEDIGIIFMTFFLWLIFIFLLICWIFYVNKVVYAHDKSQRLFWAGFPVTVTAGIAVHYLGLVKWGLDFKSTLVSAGWAFGLLMILSLFVFFGRLCRSKKLN